MKAFTVVLTYSPGVVITVEMEQKSVGKAIDSAIGMVSLNEELLLEVSVKDIDLDPDQNADS